MIGFDNENYRSDMDDYMDMWDQLQQGETGKSPEKILPVSDDFYGDDPSDTYMSFMDDQYEQECLLQEEKVKSPNPIYPGTWGRDDQLEPSWVKEDLFSEVEKLKNKLFQIENKLASKMGGEDKWVEKCHHPNDEKLMSEIGSLKKRIDKISNLIGVEDQDLLWSFEVK